jgi:hypothetical protein
MAVRTVEYQDEDHNVIITLRRASLLDGMERTLKIEGELLGRLREEKEAEDREETPEEPTSVRFIKMYTYPNCVSCVSSIENVPVDDDGTMPPKLLSPADEIPFEEFANLPEQLVLMWHEAALELNPHWVIALPGTREEAEGEAEEPGSESGSERNSSPGSSRKRPRPFPQETKGTRAGG